MSSRQEEKERRKKERLERERAAAATARRKLLLQLVGGGVVAAAIVAGVVAAIASGGGGGSDARASNDELRAAATRAGCVFRNLPVEGDTHVTEARRPSDYDSNPPTSGDHSPEPAQDGLYAAGNEPELTNWVHTLEHGRVLLQYKPGAAKATVDALQRLYEEPVLDSDPSYHMVLMRNNSQMPFEVAAVAWQHYVGCTEFRPAAIGVMRMFRDRFVDQGPEFVP